MADLKTLEHSTLVVPYEYLNKKFRIAQKTIEREFSKVGNVVEELEQILSKPTVKVDEMSGTVDNLLERLTSLKRKASEVVGEENAATNLLKKRLSYLKIPCDPKISSDQLQKWNEERVDRVIVEHLLRTGHYEIAKILAENNNLEYMSNADMFIKAREVENTLINGDTSKWSEWSSDNKSKLRRMKSALELKIRRQEFVELIRKGDRLGAVKFARKHFASMDPSMWPSLTPTMGLLAVNEIDTKIEKYRAMFAEDRWKVLVDEFRMENLRLFRMTQPLFSALLQAGISSMKTPRCCVQQHGHTGVTTRSNALREKNILPSSSVPSVDSFTAGNGNSNSNGRRRRSHTISPASTTTSLPALVEIPNNTPTAATSLRASQCPLCQPAARDLVAPLALAHTAQSHLICAYSGEPVNEDNPPVMLPNGMVYGNRSILELASKNNGKIVCPRTKQVFELADIERVFIM